MTNITEQENLLKPPKTGELIEGAVVAVGKSSIFVDLGAVGTGIIYGREFYEAKSTLRALKIGEKIFAKIVDLENDEGYIELSIKQAGKEMTWENLRQKKETQENITVKILGANKGGLLVDVSGIPAFLPVSQLSPENYPRVEGADKTKILRELQKFTGREMEVKVFDLDPREEKLILSEKAKATEKIKKVLKDYKTGDIVEGEITGVVDFGAFIRFSHSIAEKKETEEDAFELEGLIHISELDWQLIADPVEIVKVGEKVKAKIIDITDDRVFLSLKALKKDPWKNIEDKFKKDDTVKGEVTKFNPFGAFIQLTPKIQGLVHISEFGSQKKMEETLRIGEIYSFQILSIEAKDHKMALKLLTSNE